MILAAADKDQTVVLGHPKATLGRSTQAATTSGAGREAPSRAQQPPLTEEEIEEHSRIRCCVCGERVRPEEVAEHSRRCVLEPAPNLRLQLDKWCIASASMTPSEQRAFLHMRRTEELAQVEALEAVARRPTQLWWMGGRFGYVMSSKWAREWRSFVGVGRPSAETKDRPPSPINNMDLFDLDGSLRAGLREGVQHDYHVIEPPMWDFFVQVYGGGPPILRYNASGVKPALSDQQASFEGEWRDLRPDTGHGRVFDPYKGCGFDGEIRGGFLWTCTGKGLLRNGSHFEGHVVAGLPDGRGREVKPSGAVLEGIFQQGKLHGFGRITDAQGHVEEGEWEEGVLSGI
mmetsp:Transcript_114846/g.335912  ORF Transcript_114846/g.335912 Transcript_114846/m.335912 type:complete len:345 (-) Transcript_114846:105-1139(-)